MLQVLHMIALILTCFSVDGPAGKEDPKHEGQLCGHGQRLDQGAVHQGVYLYLPTLHPHPRG